MEITNEILYLKKNTDPRGFSVDILNKDKFPFILNEKFWNVCALTIKPGKVRGNHYHEKKDEYLILIHGKVEVTLENTKRAEKRCLHLSTKRNKVTMVHIKKHVAHAIKNTSNSTAVLVKYETMSHILKDSIEYKLI